MKRLLWWLLAGSRGGVNRGHILRALKERPANAHQLAESLSLDYKTVRHHLDVLLENNAIVAEGGAGAGAAKGERKYGAMFFLSPLMEKSWTDFEDVWSKTGPKEGTP